MPEAGFERLALPLLDKLFHAALNLARNEHDARDLVQDTYIKALRHFHQFRPGTNFKGWMYTILRNAHLDHCRRRKLQPVSMELDEAAAPVDAPHQLPPMEDVSDRLRRAVDKLSRPHRLLVFLCDMEGFSYKEIAEILGCPIGTVMSGLFNARQKLKDLLRP